MMTAKEGLYDELMRAICSHLKPAPYPYGMLALRILGKMGGRNRAFLRGAQMSVFIAPKEFSEEYGCFSASFSAKFVNGNNDGDCPMKMDISHFIDAACCLLDKISLKPPIEAEVLSILISYYPVYPCGESIDGTDSSLKLQDFTLNEFADPISGRGATYEDGLLAKFTEILARDSNHINALCLSSLKLAALRLVILGFSKTSYFRAISYTSVNETECAFHVGHIGASDSRQSSMEDRFCITLLFALIVSNLDSSLRVESTQILTGICSHFYLLLKSSDQHQYRRIYFVLHGAIFSALSDVRPVVYCAGTDFLHMWLKTGIPDSEQILYISDGLIADLIQIAELCSVATSYKKRMGSLRLLNELIKYLGTDARVFRNYEINMYHVIFNLLERLESENFVVFSEDAFSTLQSVINYFYPANVENANTFNNDIVIYFLKEIKHRSTVVRVISEWSLQEIAKRTRQYLKDILNSKEVDLQLPMTIEDVLDNLGVVSAISFIISFDATSIPVDEKILTMLDYVLQATENVDVNADDPLVGVRYECNAKLSFMDSRFVLESSLFPGQIPHSVDLRLSCLRLINSVFLNSSEMIFSDKFSDLRRKVFFILFKCLTLPWTEIISDAQRALAQAVIRVRNSSIPSDISLPKEVIQDGFKPIMSTIHDYKQLSIPVLKGLEALLKLFTNRAYVQIGDKFIEHLKLILDNEAYSSLAPLSGSLYPGEEQSIFAAMINIFHVLPWNSSSIGQNEFTLPREELSKFTIEFIFIVIRLESSRHNLQFQASLDSPYLPPLIRFFSRYPHETVRLLLQPAYICQEEVRISNYIIQEYSFYLIFLSCF
jgi:hypothetical protein